MQRWLICRGRGDSPLSASGWTLERHGASRRPSLQKGDLAIAYASVWQAVFAVVEVVSDPEQDPGRERWRWSFAIRPLVAVADLHDAPACEEAGIFPQSLWRHSYIRLSEEQFARARSLVERAVVRAGYDAIAPAYAEWATSFASPALATLERLLAGLEPGSEVLDLGCGNGLPIARALVERGHRVTGVDISAAQVARARRAVPGARFLLADALELELPEESFDAVVSAFVLGHVPRADQPALLQRIRGWLRPGGRVLVSFGISGTEEVAGWLGAPMFFSSWPPERSRELLAEAGLELEWSRETPVEEPGHGVVSFMWALARRQ